MAFEDILLGLVGVGIALALVTLAGMSLYRLRRTDPEIIRARVYLDFARIQRAALMFLVSSISLFFLILPLAGILVVPLAVFVVFFLTWGGLAIFASWELYVVIQPRKATLSSLPVLKAYPPKGEEEP
jgi:hypothetical protein